MQRLMTFDPSVDQSVQSTTLKGHTWKADDYSIEILPETSPKILAFRKQIKSLKSKGPAHTLSLEQTHAFPPFFRKVYIFAFFFFLHGPFFCLGNLFPESTQPSWLTSSASVLNKLPLALEFLPLDSFFANLKNWGC